MSNSKIKLSRKMKVWARQNKLGKWAMVLLFEAYRRVLVFNNADFETNMALLCYPSMVKSAAKSLFKPAFGKETPRVLNWYALSDKGLELVKSLDDALTEVSSREEIKALLQESVDDSYENLIGGVACETLGTCYIDGCNSVCSR